MAGARRRNTRWWGARWRGARWRGGAAARGDARNTRAAAGAALAVCGGGCSSPRLAWRRRGPHIATARIAADASGGTALLLRVQGGHAVPTHTHRGTECAVVLAGAFTDSGNRFARGDIQFSDPTVRHRPIAVPGEDCICLIAFDAPLRWTGPIARLFAPLLRL